MQLARRDDTREWPLYMDARHRTANPEPVVVFGGGAWAVVPADAAAEEAAAAAASAANATSSSRRFLEGFSPISSVSMSSRRAEDEKAEVAEV